MVVGATLARINYVYIFKSYEQIAKKNYVPLAM